MCLVKVKLVFICAHNLWGEKQFTIWSKHFNVNIDKSTDIKELNYMCHFAKKSQDSNLKLQIDLQFKIKIFTVILPNTAIIIHKFFGPLVWRENLQIDNTLCDDRQLTIATAQAS